MTALVAVIGLGHVVRFELIAEPTIARWLQRAIWIVAPALVLAPVAKTFWPIENGSRGA